MIIIIITIFVDSLCNIMKNKKLIAVITGDLINSRKVDAAVWMPVLDETLKQISSRYDIYRGDSFQSEVELQQAINHLFYIKAKIKSLKNLDVRMTIGIGTIDYQDAHVRTSAGEAFLHAGERFDALKKDTVAIRSPWPDLDEGLELMLQLSMEIAGRWTENMAEAVAVSLKHPDMNQHELAAVLNRKYQSQVSTELNKAGYSKIKRVIDYCTEQIVKKCYIQD
ncbi:Uncharacterised protein [Sphingobacterium spiritivorum]|nr:hypothetical protein I6J01_14825 [Sphingobacterium spiritivorum]SUJ00423.1 Uncharacterised protein [Sphingobacterium spiritivorum]